MRAAVRMLTINVYSVQDPAMLDFVSSAPCNHYFHEVALHLAEHALHFDRHLEALQAGAHSLPNYLTRAKCTLLLNHGGGMNNAVIKRGNVACHGHAFELV